jgi:hypothetical protein
MSVNDRLRRLEAAANAKLDPFAPPIDAEDCQRQLSLPIEERSLWGVRYAVTLAIMRASVPHFDPIEREKQQVSVDQLQRLYDGHRSPVRAI